MRLWLLPGLLALALGCGPSATGTPTPRGSGSGGSGGFDDAGGSGGSGGFDEPGGSGGSGGFGGSGGDGGSAGSRLRCEPGPCAIDFGLVHLGLSASAWLELCNDGDTEARIEGAEAEGPFTVASVDAEIGPRRCTPAVAVTFSPEREGPAVGRLLVSAADGPVEVRLTAEGTAPSVTCDVPDSVELFLPVGMAFSVSIPCTNRSEEDAVVRLGAVGPDADMVLPGAVRVPIPAGGVRDLWVQLWASRGGVVVATLELREEVEGGAAPIASVPVTLHAFEEPVDCGGALDFGAVPIGQFAWQFVRCENAVQLALTLAPELDAPSQAFSLVPTPPYALPACGADGSPGVGGFQVLFEPRETGLQLGRLVLRPGDPDSPVISLRGVGVSN